MKRTTVALAVLVTLAAGLVGPSEAATQPPLIIGHRGASLFGLVENTQPAFEQGVKFGDVIETDLQWSKDGWAMILHDTTLDRTTSCTGALVKTTGVKARSCGVMTFGAFLRFMQTNQDAIDLELKSADYTAKQARGVISELAKYGLTSRTTISSFDEDNIRVVKAQPGGSGVKSAVIDSTKPHTASQARALGATTAIRLDRATPDRVKALHAAGVKVWVWTARTEADYSKALDLRVDGIITDDPEATARALGVTP